MRKLSLYLTALIMILGTGCSDEVREIIQAEPDYAHVELSSNGAFVEQDGGVKQFFVASNRSVTNVVTESDWLDISVENSAITLYVNANEQDDSRMAIVEVIVGDEPDWAKARFKVMQAGAAIVDLSADETANCYIINTEQTAYFRADVKGNGLEDGNSRYFALTDSYISDASYAMLAWESTFDGDRTRSSNIIIGEPIYSAEHKSIFFTTGQNEGNALIALCDASGRILWSWHIWITNEPIGHSTANGIEWMNRNLGALSNEPDDVANRGMLYQWGRKDPFLPSPASYVNMPTHQYDEEFNILESEEEYYAIQDAIEALRLEVNIFNEQRGDGALEWQYIGREAPVALDTPGNIEYAIEHPTTFLACRTDIPIGEYVFDWYMQQDLMNSMGVMMQSDSQLWGDAELGTDYKTAFDPCPPGYCIPPRGAFGEIPEGYACTYGADEWEMVQHGWRWTGGNGDFFPSTGNLDVSGLIGDTSERILYWTAESFGANADGFGKAATLFVTFNEVFYGIYPIMDPYEAASWYSYGARAMAAPVRCVRDVK